VCELTETSALGEKDFGVAVAVLAHGVFAAGEDDARTVLRERGRGRACKRQLRESVRRGDVGGEEPEARARADRGEVCARLEGDSAAVAA
jgi:hypothetical protein